MKLMLVCVVVQAICLSVGHGEVGEFKCQRVNLITIKQMLGDLHSTYEARTRIGRDMFTRYI